MKTSEPITPDVTPPASEKIEVKDIPPPGGEGGGVDVVVTTDDKGGIKDVDLKPVEEEKPAAKVEVKSTTEEKPAAEVKPTTPEKFEITLPENLMATKEQLVEVAKIAKDSGLKPEQAQAMVDKVNEAVKSFHDLIVAKTAEISQSGVEALKVDQKLGAGNYGQTLETMKGVFKGYPDAEKLLNQAGLTHNPKIVEMLVGMKSQTNIVPKEQTPLVNPNPPNVNQNIRQPEFLEGTMDVQKWYDETYANQA